MDNLEHVAQEIPPEREPERETLDVNRWEDDGGRENKEQVDHE